MDYQKAEKEIITVAEMARMCGLSRSRFYSLVKDGIMPIPSCNAVTNRPFYTREQQEQCLLVRKTNCGINGKPILFYAVRFDHQSINNSSPAKSKRLSVRQNNHTAKVTKTDPIIEELQHGLEQLGISDVPETKIRAVLADTYPDGYTNIATATLLMGLFRHLKNSGETNG